MTAEYKYQKYIPEPYNIAAETFDRNGNNAFGNKIAAYYKELTYTYRDFERLVNKAAGALKKLGVGMEERVMLVLYDSPEAVASFYGALKIGAVPIPINYMYTSDDFRYLLNNSRARTIVCHEDFIDTVEGWSDVLLYLKNVIIVGAPKRRHHIAFHEILQQAPEKVVPAYTTTDDSAFWLYTSGSTGAPKAAVHLQHDPYFSLDNYGRKVIGMTHDDIVLSASKFFFAYGLGNNFLFPFQLGASVVLLPDRPLPETIFETISKYRPTLFFGVPTLYSNMLQIKDAEKKYDLSSLRLCMSAGEALPKAIFSEWKRRFGVEILDGIGSTEMLHIFISNQPGEAKPGSSGKVVPGYEAKIIDESGREIPDGELGTLFVKGDSAAAFYWANHDKTKASMQGEWFNTGDKYYRDEEGFYYFGGRENDMLKVGGIWVSPAEIEDTLTSHPAVLQAAVIGKEDENNLIKPKAFIVLKDEYDASQSLARELQMYVKTTLAPFKYPRWVEFTEELPTTATGKVQRYKLRKAA